MATPYKNDLKHGSQIKYYPSGNIMRITPWVEGKIHGTEIEYFDYVESPVFQKTPYVDGVIHGTRETFYANGDKTVEAIYEHGDLQKVTHF